MNQKKENLDTTDKKTNVKNKKLKFNATKPFFNLKSRK